MNVDPRISSIIAAQPYPLMFVTISGAHLYGFPSPDSDYDLRGVHILPPFEVLGLETGPETIEISRDDQGLEIDLVSHDARKFFQLLLRRNGYVLEQIFSPLIIHTTPQHEELKSISHDCITRHHAHHYLGFADTQWTLFAKETPPRVKPLLYIYRVLLTGIHLMRTGRVEANLLTLNQLFNLPQVPELVERKLAGKEQSTLSDADVGFHRGEYERLVAELEQASAQSTLPDQPSGRAALHNLLLRLRELR